MSLFRQFLSFLFKISALKLIKKRDNISQLKLPSLNVLLTVCSSLYIFCNRSHLKRNGLRNSQFHYTRYVWPLSIRPLAGDAVVMSRKLVERLVSKSCCGRGVRSDKPIPLLGQALLRTVRASFPAYGSSLYKAMMARFILSIGVE